MAIIAILIFTIFFKLNRFLHSTASSSSSSSSSVPSLPSLPLTSQNDIELDKKIEKKITDIQIKLDEISAELSATKKNQKEDVANLASVVADNVTAATTAAATVAVSVTAPIISSGLFDRYSDTSTPKAEFLELDLNSMSDVQAHKKPEILNPELRGIVDLKKSNAVSSSSSSSSITSTLAQTSDSNLTLNDHTSHSDKTNNLYQNFHSTSENKSQNRNFNYPLTYFNNPQNKTDKEQRNYEHDKDYKEIEFPADKEDLNLNNKLSSSNEKNSNPEIDRIDKEILGALQRLGGVDYTNSNDNNNNDSNPDKNDKLNNINKNNIVKKVGSKDNDNDNAKGASNHTSK